MGFSKERITRLLYRKVIDRANTSLVLSKNLAILSLESSIWVWKSSVSDCETLSKAVSSWVWERQKQEFRYWEMSGHLCKKGHLKPIPPFSLNSNKSDHEDLDSKGYPVTWNNKNITQKKSNSLIHKDHKFRHSWKSLRKQPSWIHAFITLSWGNICGISCIHFFCLFV